MMGNIFAEIGKLGLFLGRQHFAKEKFLDYLGSPEKDWYMTACSPLSLLPSVFLNSVLLPRQCPRVIEVVFQ